MVSFPNAKINLGLRILAKREDGFHDLETVFYPVRIRDGLEIIDTDSEFQFSSSGNRVTCAMDDNLCVKAYRLLRRDFPSLPSCHIHLHKIIPEGAGLAGGSSDAAFTLLLLNRKFGLGLKQTALLHYAGQLGSDCPFFILNHPCHATGTGNLLQPLPLDLSAYRILIINPGIRVETKMAYSKIVPSGSSRQILIEALQKPVESWKGTVLNDFEEVVFKEYPEIAGIKQKLYENGALFALMSGSGSSVFGIFPDRTDIRFPAGYFRIWV